MIQSTYRFSLDIHEDHSNVCLNVKKGDTNSRKLYITLMENGNPYEISEDCYAVFTATKPDGKLVSNDCVIEDDTIIYELPPQYTAVSGVMDCEVQLYGADDALLTSPRFIIMVAGTIADDPGNVNGNGSGGGLDGIGKGNTTNIRSGATVSEINAIIAGAEGTILFPAGKEIAISQQIYIANKKNLVIDFNGCTIKQASQFPESNVARVDRNTLVLVDNCSGIVIRNGVFDNDTQSNGLSNCSGVCLYKSVSTVKDCAFKNADYHHLVVKNGYVVGENLTFKNLGNTDGMSDVYTTCDDGGSVETHWRNIKSTRDSRCLGQLFYFGVTTDEQKNYHTVDTAAANNCGPVIDLRGGEGYFKNIRGDNCGILLAQTTGNVTEANSPAVTFENVHLTDVIPDSSAAGIFLSSCRKAHFNNILIERSVETSNNLFRCIRLGYSTDRVSDVRISNFRYKGLAPWTFLSVQKDTSCFIENAVAETQPTAWAVYSSDSTGKNTIKIENLECENKKIRELSETPARIVMSNAYRSFGTTAERPTPFPCETVFYYDTDLGKPVLWNGSAWEGIAGPDATSVTIAKAEDGTVTITIPMSDGTTDTCVLNPGEDGWPVSATMNGVTKPIEWEGW